MLYFAVLCSDVSYLDLLTSVSVDCALCSTGPHGKLTTTPLCILNHLSSSFTHSCLALKKKKIHM